MSKRFTQIDDHNRGDHSYLDPGDDCWHIGEYHAGEGYAFGETNDLISNFKKKMDKKGRNEWQYKGIATRQIADDISKLFPNKKGSMNGVLIVPIPPSKHVDDKLYDPRLSQCLELAAAANPEIHWSECLKQVKSTPAFHENDGPRLRPDELAALYEIDTSFIPASTRTIILFDDVITTGSHFKAGKIKFSQALPSLNVLGMFVARRIVKETPPIGFIDIDF